MDKKSFFSGIMIAGFFLSQMGIYLSFSQMFKSVDTSSQVAQNTYFGPTHPEPNQEELVKVQILIKDSQESAGPQIESVIFDHQEIPLKPRDIFGKRGEAGFQVMPGKYKLQWTTNRTRYAWPRTNTHVEEVLISPRDLWVQIVIEGDCASIR